MRSLRMKMVMIMVILILALMLTTGAFLMSGVGNFYVSQFYEQMEETFTPEFIVQLQRLSEEDNAPAQMKALLMAQAGLGIDITGRNVYILDQTGSVLQPEDQRRHDAEHPLRHERRGRPEQRDHEQLYGPRRAGRRRVRQLYRLHPR